MSGGYFNYDQHRIDLIVEKLEELVEEEKANSTYSAETLERFKEGLRYLKLAKIYAQRIDWLVSGDDGEKSFHERLVKELNALTRCSMDNAKSGWVNFPIADTRWEDTGEGGMVVKLVVCDDEGSFATCCGAEVTDLLVASFIGDDRIPSAPESECYHFPWVNEDYVGVVEGRLSREYLAAVVLGTTDWSGWDDVAEQYWVCRFDDLTEEGKALYRQIEALYPGCELHLLTFLDT